MAEQAQALIFDLDGTLLDTQKIHQAVEEYIAHKLGLKKIGSTDGWDLKTSLERLGLKNEKDWQECVRMYHKFEEQIGATIFPGVNEFLKTLKKQGIVVGCLTNRSASTISFKVIRKAGLDTNLFDVFITYDKSLLKTRIKKWLGLIKEYPAKHKSSPLPKPDPAAFDPAYPLLHNLPGFPGTVWYVGDTLVDLKCAQKNCFRFAGVLTGCVKDASVWREHNADVIVPSITDLKIIFCS